MTHKPLERKPWDGPTETMRQVTDAVNANNSKIPTLWAEHDFEVRYIDKDGGSHLEVGDGSLMYRRPREMKFIGEKAGIGRVFVVGSTPDRYWMAIITPKEATQWWGSYAKVGGAAVKQLPIRPDLLIDVLGISEIDSDFLKAPVPTMRFNPDQWAYMLLWNNKLPDRWWAEKEVWYDLKNKWPVKVILYDENGRVMVRANLGKHQRVNAPEVPEAQRPVVPTEYRLFFPESKATMLINLKDMALRSSKGVPNERSIRFGIEGGVNKVVELDEQSEP